MALGVGEEHVDFWCEEFHDDLIYTIRQAITHNKSWWSFANMEAPGDETQ